MGETTKAAIKLIIVIVLGIVVSTLIKSVEEVKPETNVKKELVSDE